MPTTPTNEDFGHLSPGERRFLTVFSLIVAACLLGGLAAAALVNHSLRAWVGVVIGATCAMLTLMIAQGVRPLPGSLITSSVGRASLLLAAGAGAIGGLVTGLILPSHPLGEATATGAGFLLLWNIRERMLRRLYGPAA